VRTLVGRGQSIDATVGTGNLTDTRPHRGSVGLKKGARMKRTKRIVMAIMTSALFAAAFAAVATAAPPVVTTSAATAVDSDRATLNGKVTGSGNITYYFEYGTTVSYGSKTAEKVTVSSSVTAGISKLQPNTTYHVRLVGSNKDGKTLGADKTFKTALQGASWTLGGERLSDLEISEQNVELEGGLTTFAGSPAGDVIDCAVTEGFGTIDDVGSGTVEIYFSECEMAYQHSFGCVLTDSSFVSESPLSLDTSAKYVAFSAMILITIEDKSPTETCDLIPEAKNSTYVTGNYVGEVGSAGYELPITMSKAVKEAAWAPGVYDEELFGNGLWIQGITNQGAAWVDGSLNVRIPGAGKVLGVSPAEFE
jgi:hypothetical protein